MAMQASCLLVCLELSHLAELRVRNMAISLVTKILVVGIGLSVRLLGVGGEGRFVVWFGV